MKTSGLFSTHGFTIPVQSSKPVKIIFFGDVHRDSPLHAHQEWQEFLAYAKAQKNAYFFGMGDYLDSTSTTERECLGGISPKMHDTFRNDIQELQLAKIELMAKELAFMRGRIIGMLNGNHYFQFQSGINSDQKLCELLAAKYLGVCSFVRLTFESDGRRQTRDLFAHHGQGAARLVGGSLNRVAQMFENAEADFVAMGHDHKRAVVPGQPRLFLGNYSTKSRQYELKSRDTWVIRSGSYLKAYVPGASSYNVDACRGPSSLGHVELILTVREGKKSAGRETRIDVQGVS